MITVKLQGGLGNQLFQYAFAKTLAARLNCDYRLDISFFEKDNRSYPHFVPRSYALDIFQTDFPTTSHHHPFYTSPNRALTWLRKRLSDWVDLKGYIAETPLVDSQTLKDHTYYEGYWQSEKYFWEIGTEIRQELVFKNPINPLANHIVAKIKTTESVCIHVRRGDFLTNPNYDILTIEYYQKAIGLLRKQYSNLHFFVFSDDIYWCKLQDWNTSNLIYISDNQLFDLRDEFELMIHCKHHVIANSTLSWWAAWLNSHPKKTVIAPQKWFADNMKIDGLLPETWIII